MALTSDKSREPSPVLERHENQSFKQDGSVEEDIPTSQDNNLEKGFKLDQQIQQTLGDNEVNSSAEPRCCPNKQLILKYRLLGKILQIQ